MTREERKKFENLNSSYNKYWVPCVWFSSLAAQARREGRIRDNSALKLLLEVGLRGRYTCRIESIVALYFGVGRGRLASHLPIVRSPSTLTNALISMGAAL